MNKIAIIMVLVGLSGFQPTILEQNLPKKPVRNPSKNENNMKEVIKFEFKPLPFEYDTLDPFKDRKTVEIYYSKHHKTYYENFLAGFRPDCQV